MKILIASRNAHKIQEIREIFDLPGVEWVSAADVPGLHDVEEDGDTFEANAIKKATELARATGLWALADDSGLEVAALGNAPGVYSARYAGEPCDHARNNAKLLRELDGQRDRSARFRCVAALSDPAGRAETVSGSCPGRIIERLRGTEGFGYDPLFVPDGFEQTFAEMGAEQKNRLSHRGRAMSRAKDKWGGLIASNAGGFA
ncbi:MAG: XTP/dITP diphosphatase [Kiritimatiellae bacterium]|jgi:XTP/dITP diphosphohydrolase|nr:XTP/dITP diphosphatase [Kiritimatiellia bacterium]MDD4117815.1 XTP/dITP diphosphatase [Kiritimatiellia bacterium]NCC92629.1 XTP/dITP diphosphatase [Opitutae bacterium]